MRTRSEEEIKLINKIYRKFWWKFKLIALVDCIEKKILKFLS